MLMGFSLRKLRVVNDQKIDKPKRSVSLILSLVKQIPLSSRSPSLPLFLSLSIPSLNHCLSAFSITLMHWPSACSLTSTLSLSHTHTHTHSLSHTHTHSLSLSHSHTLSLTHTHTLSHCLTHTHSFSHTHTLSHTHTHSHSGLTHSVTHSLTHS